MGYALPFSMILAGCALTANYDVHGRITDVTLSAGIATPEAPAEGRQKIRGLGAVYTGEAAVLGFYSVDTARIGACGAIIITDHPERINPALIRPC